MNECILIPSTANVKDNIQDLLYYQHCYVHPTVTYVTFDDAFDCGTA